MQKNRDHLTDHGVLYLCEASERLQASQSLLVNLEAPAVAGNCRDEKYIQRKLNLFKCSEKSNLKSSRSALSFILCPDFVQDDAFV